MKTQSLTLTLSLLEREREHLNRSNEQFGTLKPINVTAKEFPLPVRWGEGQGEGFVPIARDFPSFEKS